MRRLPESDDCRFDASFALKKHLSVGQSGTDVLKTIACGARAVFIGRPVLWGLATGSETGVRYVLEMVRQKFDLAMALSGCPTLSSITRDLIRRSG
jgi:4-hydroxymandelate oxidase